MEVDNSEVKKKMCFCCSSEDHFIRNCPKPDTRRENKKNIQDVKVEMDDEKANNENGPKLSSEQHGPAEQDWSRSI
jgi:hypothetical protein